MKTAVIYTRSAVQSQNSNADTLMKQQETLKAYCSKHNIRILASFQEYRSANTSPRPELEGALDFAMRNNVDYILFTEWSRISRFVYDVIDFIGLTRKNNIKAQAINQPLEFNAPDEIVMSNICHVVGTLVSESHSIRIKNGIKAAKARREKGVRRI